MWFLRLRQKPLKSLVRFRCGSLKTMALVIPSSESEKQVVGCDGMAITQVNRNLESRWARWGRSLAPVKSPLKELWGASGCGPRDITEVEREKGLTAHTRAGPRKGQDPTSAVRKKWVAAWKRQTDSSRRSGPVVACYGPGRFAFLTIIIKSCWGKFNVLPSSKKHSSLAEASARLVKFKVI